MKLINKKFVLVFCICFLSQILELHCQRSHNNKVKLLHDISTYLKSEFGMEISKQFYTKWDENETGHHVVYFSKPDEIDGHQRGFGDEKSAIDFRVKQDSLGFHTMIYHTYGSAAVRLSEHLLSYSEESIGFIGFHEATHTHFNNKGTRLPYSVNEAACDVLANYATVEFAKKDKRITYLKAKKQRKYIEKIGNLVNLASSDLKSGQTSKFIEKSRILEKKVGKLNNDYFEDSFLKDRYFYEINNAFLLRNTYYSKYYFKLKELLILTDIKTFLKVLDSLPKKEEECFAAINTAIDEAKIP